MNLVLASRKSTVETTVWLQIFVVENFRNFRNYTVITKILFTKFSSQLIILDTIEAQGEFGIK